MVVGPQNRQQQREQHRGMVDRPHKDRKRLVLRIQSVLVRELIRRTSFMCAAAAAAGLSLFLAGDAKASATRTKSKTKDKAQ
jgi:hypothetical protein